MKLKKVIAPYLLLLLIIISGCKDNPEVPQEAEADISDIKFANMMGNANINKNLQTISAEISNSPNSDMRELILTFTLSNGASAYVNDVPQISGISANDFSKSSIEYTVISGDKKKTKKWTITVMKRFDDSFAYEFGGLITENTILAAATYDINNDVEIADDVYFVIEAGSVLKLAPCTRIIFNSNSKLSAEGTEQLPIKFISINENDELGNDAWSDIYIKDATVELAYCIFDNGGGCNNKPLIYLENSIAGIKYCSFNNILNTTVYLDATSMFRIFEYNNMKNCSETIDNCYPIHYKNINTILNLEGGNTISTSKGIYIETTNISNNITFTGQPCPYIIADNITSSGNNIAVFVQHSVSFVINKGKSINLGTAGAIKFIAKGTQDNPIKFYSKENQAGSWEGFVFGNMLLSGSTLEYCDINYAGNGGSSGAIKCVNTNSANLLIKNCVIRNTNSHGIYISSNSSAQLIDNQFINIPSGFQNIYNQ